MTAKPQRCVRPSPSALGEGHLELLRPGHPLWGRNRHRLATSALSGLGRLSEHSALGSRPTCTLSPAFLLPASVSLLGIPAPPQLPSLGLRGLPLCPRPSASRGINNGVTNIFEQISGWEHMRENGFLHLAHRSQNPRRKDQGGGRGSEWTPSSCDHKITTSPARAGAPGPPCCTPLLPLPAMPGSPPLRCGAVRPPLSGLRPPRGCRAPAPQKNQKKPARGVRASGAGPWRCCF
ncbi:uncharacterized protein LOC117795734 [Ailuropoda melanoleuca]|uniref:uncharacterized protein LOC117795734 n=1 Tax=Ailuropoda melanoleuca TaxID=9646 RepID=UPI001494DAFC|nr:uncharacterized protein LOC117795734 [Ailuropoda melanoleuca]